MGRERRAIMAPTVVSGCSCDLALGRMAAICLERSARSVGLSRQEVVVAIADLAAVDLKLRRQQAEDRP